MSIEAMKQWLEAMLQVSPSHHSMPSRVGPKEAFDQLMAAITSLRQAIADFEKQEPVAWMSLMKEARDNCKASIVEDGISSMRKEYRIDLERRLTDYINTHPQPKREPLTDEQIWDAYMKAPVDIDCHVSDLHKFARAIEAAHGIKE